MSDLGRSVSPDQLNLASAMRAVADKALAIASDVTLIFVTNLQSGDVADVGPAGLLNTAQHYTRSQAEEIIRSLQSLGVTVQTYFTEVEFVRAMVGVDRRDDQRHRVVFTTAEGGSGSGRRALVPAICNLLGLPVLNSGAHACSIARHKFHAGAVLGRVGVRVPTTWQFGDHGWLGDQPPPDGSRVIVKPTYESMCIGVDEDSVQIVDAVFQRFVRSRRDVFRQPVVVQEFISGEEVGVPLVRVGRTFALPPVAFRRANGEPYGHLAKTFQAENIDHDTSHAFFEAPPAQYAAIQRTAVLAFDALEMRGVGRVDVRVDADGRAWVFDANESPPPLRQTSYALAMQSLGFSIEEMLAVWLGICLLDFGIVSGV